MSIDPFTDIQICRCDVVDKNGEVIYVVQLPSTSTLDSVFIKGKVYIKKTDGSIPFTFYRQPSGAGLAA